MSHHGLTQSFPSLAQIVNFSISGLAVASLVQPHPMTTSYNQFHFHSDHSLLSGTPYFLHPAYSILSTVPSGSYKVSNPSCPALLVL